MFAIMTDNGGSSSSQDDWKHANARSISIERLEAAEASDTRVIRSIDKTITGSIPSPEKVVEEKPEEKRVEQELTVLELIRKNSDVAPSVSTGTARVSVTVKEGDTLFGISIRHGIGLEELASLNGLEEPYTIKVGQTLYVAR